ncbi:MerR family transcriptional regulator [Maribacter algicola]|uniref:MerR family transcriptional regulator n=1 Tax=Meishania litoralis TaxID=3434685 RepID=A0ACC7LJG8_9FLAO
MSTYSMSDIVSLTDFKAHTLRKWETRYNFLEPKRTDTNIRYYTDDQLRMLLNIGILLRNGHRISHIDKMSQKELNNKVSEILLKASPKDDINALVLCMLEMNEVRFSEILGRHIMRSGLMKTITNLVYPFLNHVGVLWGTNKALPAQEHFISNLIKQKILSAIEAIPHPKDDAPKIVLFLMEEETHEIGLLLAYYLAKEMGWKTFYLGQNVPQEDLRSVVQLVKPQLMMTLLTISRPLKTKTLINSLLASTTSPIAMAGSAKLLKNLEESDQIVVLKSPEEFIGLLNEKMESATASI